MFIKCKTEEYQQDGKAYHKFSVGIFGLQVYSSEIETTNRQTVDNLTKSIKKHKTIKGFSNETI